MRVGIPREVKNHEYRVAITPSGVHELVSRGHTVLIEEGAGEGSSISDDEYRGAGARIRRDADEVWAEADLLLKVKEPIAEEFHRLRKDLVLFTYLHLAASRQCTDALVSAGTTAIAYETVRLPNGSIPLLTPMSEVAGRLAAQEGAHLLSRPFGGRGVLPGGTPGVRPATVVVIGAGIAGMNAATVALGMGADVTVLDRNLDRLREIDGLYGGRVRTLASSSYEVEQQVAESDMVVGAVLVFGAKAPKLVSNGLVAQARSGSVFVDVSIDQGGCFEDSRPTTHAEPTYQVHGSVFYCVANMPGAVPHTSTYALTNATLPYVLALADEGWRRALRHDAPLAEGLNTHDGLITCAPVGEAHGLPTTPVDQILAA